MLIDGDMRNSSGWSVFFGLGQNAAWFIRIYGISVLAIQQL